MSKIISEEKFDRMAEELELTKIQLEEAYKDNLANSKVWEHKYNEVARENVKLKKIIKKLKAEKGILSRTVMILSEEGMSNE